MFWFAKIAYTSFWMWLNNIIIQSMATITGSNMKPKFQVLVFQLGRVTWKARRKKIDTKWNGFQVRDKLKKNTLKEQWIVLIVKKCLLLPKCRNLGQKRNSLIYITATYTSWYIILTRACLPGFWMRSMDV